MGERDHEDGERRTGGGWGVNTLELGKGLAGMVGHGLMGPR